MEELTYFVRHTSGAYMGEITEFGDCQIYSSPLGAKSIKYLRDAKKFVARLKEDTLYGAAGLLSKDFKIVLFKIKFEEMQL